MHVFFQLIALVSYMEIQPIACVDEEIPKFKHYCKVCKKGFMCGRALGGHMRAHGIGDIDNGIIDDDDDEESDCEEKYGGSEQGESIKRMYKLRSNPNRLQSCRNCEHCGKEFFCWKSFLEHGKCVSDETSESLVSSPSESTGEDYDRRRAGGWLKRKRSFRANVGSFNSTSLSSEEEDLQLARCLLQLANTKVNLPLVEESEESCAASASREREERWNTKTFYNTITSRLHLDNKARESNVKGLFECKACKKVFNSHQALGGHRASHKKVKGCYAAKQEPQLDETSLNNEDAIARQELLTLSKASSSYHYKQPSTFVGAARRKSKVHECSICHRVFSSGQALGGHKRCHWITSNLPDTSSLAKFQFPDKNTYPPIQIRPKTDTVLQSNVLDLNNFPTWTDDKQERFEVSTDMHSHPLIKRDSYLPHNSELEYHNKNNNDKGNCKINEKNTTTVDDRMKIVDDDEAGNRLKCTTKLSDLKDLKDNREDSSQWLQVGLGSTSEVVADV